MDVSVLNALLFTLAAVMLLGSPGPGIAALIAVGRGRGFTGGLPFFGGLQIGLALAAAVSAAGFFSIVQTLPFAMTTLTIVATGYLVWLAFQIATATVGQDDVEKRSGIAMTSGGGFVLGIANPKAYLAFLSLMGSYALVPSSGSADSALKWLLCVIVMIIVDAAWLWLGAVMGKANLEPATERTLNIVMGGTILATALLALI